MRCPLARVCLLIVASLAACDTGDGTAPELLESTTSPNVELALERPSGGRVSGEVTLGIRWSGTDEPAGVMGELTWDPAQASFVGQVPTEGTLVIVNEREVGAGRMRFVAVAPRGLEARTALFVFGGRDPLASVRLEALEATLIDGTEVVPANGPTRTSQTLPPPSSARTLTDEAWLQHLGQPSEEPWRFPGQSLVFGDPSQSGTINFTDVIFTSRAAVGIEECFVDAVSRDCIAANVVPANLPGLGEAGDDCAPGIDVCGTLLRTVNTSDAVAISRRAVGLDQPVVGEAIPRTPVSDTVALAGTITGSRILAADTVYRLTAVVTVGEDTGSAGELVIEAGTRIEAAATTAAVVVSRNGRIVAQGTQYQPVEFSCAGSVSPGCWTGLILNGNATVNTGAANAPVSGRSSGGCFELGGGSAGTYGGCADADSSGVLRWVRVLGGGAGGLPALDLRGLGSNTVLDQLYVLDSGGDGVRMRGGTADLTRVRAMRPGGAGMSWDDGWRGRFQFGVVQAGPATARALDGSNSPTNFNAVPRSAPEIRNVSVVGPADPLASNPSASSIRLRQGTAGQLRSLLVYAQPDPTSFLLDVDDAATWTQLENGDLRLDSSLIVGFGRLGDLDADDEFGGFNSPDVEGQYLRDPDRGMTLVASFAQADSVLRAPWANIPDLRLRPGSLSSTPCPPATDPFFEAVTYCGAAPASPARGFIPWFEPSPLVAFTRVPLDPQPAYLEITVRANVGDQPVLPGVVLSGPADGVTGTDGVYRGYVPLSDGAVAFTLSNLPSGCTGSSVYFVLGLQPGEERSTSILAECS